MGSVCTSVVVFHRSMVNCRRGWGCLHCYLCILLYVKLHWCSGLPYIYGQLEEGVGLSVLVSVHTSICETSSV